MSNGTHLALGDIAEIAAVSLLPAISRLAGSAARIKTQFDGLTLEVEEDLERLQQIGAIEGIGSSIRTATDAEQLARALAGGTTEKFVGIYFDRRLRLIGFRILSAGNSSGTIADPIEVFRPAIEMHASAVIIAHNHPSGDGTPSREDDQVTRHVAEGCATLGLILLDHIILGRAGNFTSYAQRGSPHLKASPTSLYRLTPDPGCPCDPSPPALASTLARGPRSGSRPLTQTPRPALRR